MERKPTGQYVVSEYFGEQVRAFIPAPLPPHPPLEMGGARLQALEVAVLALGRLDSAIHTAPDLLTNRLVFFTSLREAVLSSQIEGMEPSLADFLAYEAGSPSDDSQDDLVEVAQYLVAFNHGLNRLRQDDFPLSNRLIREMHGILMDQGRGKSKAPGEFRRTQNWIGGTRPGNAVFVPPPHAEVEGCMSQLERFFHARDDGLPLLVRAGLAHVQFETIHPFLDGNGRIGRMLIPLLLCEAGYLQEPVLYLSLFFKQHRFLYYDLLGHLRFTGDWESWVDFFLEAVSVTARDAYQAIIKMNDLIEEDRKQINKTGRRSRSLLRVHDQLSGRPINTITGLAQATGLTFATVGEALQQLTKLGVVREMTGQARNRIYAYHQLLQILNQGTETPLN